MTENSKQDNDIDEIVDEISERLNVLKAATGEPEAAKALELVGSVFDLLGTLVYDVRRIADALEKRG